jgi:hypothetical protein
MAAFQNQVGNGLRSLHMFSTRYRMNQFFSRRDVR